MAETIRYITSLPLDELRLLKPIPVEETVDETDKGLQCWRWYCRPAKFGFTSSHPGDTFETMVSHVIAEAVSRRFLLSWMRCEGEIDQWRGIFSDLAKYVAPAGPMSVIMAEKLARYLYVSRSGSRIEQFGGGKTVERSNRTGFRFFLPKPEDQPGA